MEYVRIYEMPACKMAVSQCGMFGDGKLEVFNEWFNSLPQTMFPRNFLWYDKTQGGLVWYYMCDDITIVPEEFKVIDFPGGLYAVAADEDQKDNTNALNAIHDFIEKKGCFEEDKTREYLGNVITSQSAGEAMGYNQMDYYVPIKIK